jgi:hypothetical protein
VSDHSRIADHPLPFSPAGLLESPRRMPRALRASLLALLIASSATAGAQQADDDAIASGEPVACAQRDDAGHCVVTDESSTPPAATADSAALEAAHKAAIRHRDLERRALHELLLQRACSNQKTYCALNAAPGCAAQLAQMCTAAAQQAATCLKQAVSYCAAFPQNTHCLKDRQAQCPSAKKQKIEVLLAKYPKLSAQQVEHIKQVARQMDANLGSWVGDLFRWLGL